VYLAIYHEMNSIWAFGCNGPVENSKGLGIKTNNRGGERALIRADTKRPRRSAVFWGKAGRLLLSFVLFDSLGDFAVVFQVLPKGNLVFRDVHSVLWTVQLIAELGQRQV
jgi:hypothetical protein